MKTCISEHVSSQKKHVRMAFALYKVRKGKCLERHPHCKNGNSMYRTSVIIMVQMQNVVNGYDYVLYIYVQNNSLMMNIFRLIQRWGCFWKVYMKRFLWWLCWVIWNVGDAVNINATKKMLKSWYFLHIIIRRRGCCDCFLL